MKLTLLAKSSRKKYFFNAIGKSCVAKPVARPPRRKRRPAGGGKAAMRVGALMASLWWPMRNRAHGEIWWHVKIENIEALK